MAFNVQNKNFLGLLHKLGFDLNNFPDKTFDGLFDSVPTEINHFFDWFLKNITADNVLTEVEQALYFEAEKNHKLPTEDEVNYVLSSCDFTYEELQALDVNFVNNSLTEELSDSKECLVELNKTLSNLESNYNAIKKKINELNESVNIRKKQLISAKKSWNDTNLSCNSKLDEIKTLLSKPEIKIDFSFCPNFLSVKNTTTLSVLDYIKSFNNEMMSSSNVSELPFLKEDLSCIETYLILSQGFLKEKKARIQVLSDVLLNKSLNKSFSDSNYENLIQLHLMNKDRTPVKLAEDIKKLEKELYEKMCSLSEFETQKIIDEYLLRKTDLNLVYLSDLTVIRDYLESNQGFDVWLIDILTASLKSSENTLQLKKELYNELKEEKRNRDNDNCNLEMKIQRYKTLSVRMNQHPLLLALKNSLDIENPENNDESFSKVTELMSYAVDDSNFITPKFRLSLKSSIRFLFDNKLRGPTSQLFFVPIDLLLKYQKTEEREHEYSQKIRQLANKYLETKELISKSDRKKVLAWISFLTNSKPLQN